MFFFYIAVILDVKNKDFFLRIKILHLLSKKLKISYNTIWVNQIL